MQGEEQRIRVKINEGQENQEVMDFDPRLSKMGALLLEMDHAQDYPIPTNIIKRSFPLQFMKEFAEKHQYNPESYKIKKPLTTNVFKDVVDEKTFELCKKYTDLKNAEEAEEIINLANYLRFDILEEAIMAALAVNYFVGNNQKQIDEFIKTNRLDNLTPSQISQIMEEHKDIFEQLEAKHKEKVVNQQQQ